MAGINLLIGTYAAAGGGGVYPLHLDGDRAAPGEPLAAIADASWGIATPDGYAFVEERNHGRVTITDRDLAVKAHVDSGGAAPCHLALHGRGLAVANYGDGRVALLTRDGGRHVHQGDGSGPDAARQAGPHAHWVGVDPADGRLCYIDLGSDRIWALPVDADGFGQPVTLYHAPPGSGPRHLAWHPRLPVAYLVNELAATVTVLDRAGEGWRARAILPTLPPGVAADNLGGAIAIDAPGGRLFVTNRGHDSVVAFAIEAAGDLSLVAHQPSGGASPRHLLLLEDAGRLIVCNEQGGSVAILPLALDAPPRVVTIPGAAFAIRIDREPS